jgi:hypothetical protein
VYDHPGLQKYSEHPMTEGEPENLSQEGKPEAGAPRWTYAVGAIVSAVAVVWGIVHFFLEPKEAPKPETAATTSSTTNMSVKGDKNAIVGVMSGGTITINGGAAPSASASASSSSASSGP